MTVNWDRPNVAVWCWPSAGYFCTVRTKKAKKNILWFQNKLLTEGDGKRGTVVFHLSACFCLSVCLSPCLTVTHCAITWTDTVAKCRGERASQTDWGMWSERSRRRGGRHRLDVGGGLYRHKMKRAHRQSNINTSCLCIQCILFVDA